MSLLALVVMAAALRFGEPSAGSGERWFRGAAVPIWQLISAPPAFLGPVGWPLRGVLCLAKT